MNLKQIREASHTLANATAEERSMILAFARDIKAAYSTNPGGGPPPVAKPRKPRKVQTAAAPTFADGIPPVPPAPVTTGKKRGRKPKQQPQTVAVPSNTTAAVGDDIDSALASVGAEPVA